LTAGWRVEITPPARRDLRRVDPPVRQRVLVRLDRDQFAIFVLRVLPRGRAYRD
jgi:mRNA-degrading endonuclease RelE of RelBE toxin-antitoxin system